MKSQQRIQLLEKENRELKASLKDTLNEKKNLSVKWQKASSQITRLLSKQKQKVDDDTATDLEKELQEYKFKYVDVNTELRINKESEELYKQQINSRVEELAEELTQ